MNRRQAATTAGSAECHFGRLLFTLYNYLTDWSDSVARRL